MSSPRTRGYVSAVSLRSQSRLRRGHSRPHSQREAISSACETRRRRLRSAFQARAVVVYRATCSCELCAAVFATIASFKPIYEGGRQLCDRYPLLEDFIELAEHSLLLRGPSRSGGRADDRLEPRRRRFARRELSRENALQESLPRHRIAVYGRQRHRLEGKVRNVFTGLFLLAAAASPVAVPSSAIFAATQSPSTTPVPSATPTQPPASVVARVCIPPGVDYMVDNWNFVSPYLLCLVSDAHSGTAELLKRTATGSFSQISHGGGDLPVIGLEAYGVPASIATKLRSGLHS
jgi:hypothetical protein